MKNSPNTMPPLFFGVQMKRVKDGFSLESRKARARVLKQTDDRWVASLATVHPNENWYFGAGKCFKNSDDAAAHLEFLIRSLGSIEASFIETEASHA